MNRTLTISKGAVTYAEILQQPELWLTTAERMRHASTGWLESAGPVVIAGAGTSAYAGSAIAAAWPGAAAVPTTDLLLNTSFYFQGGGVLISLARSGDSPESMAVVRRVQQEYPDVRHLAITCNPEGQLANAAGVEAIVLDPRTNDRGLAMTSAFSNLVLAGLCLRHQREIDAALPAIAARTQAALPLLDRSADAVAQLPLSRMTVLASPPLEAAARETSLKVLEMSAGNIVAIPETFLGLRHGPMCFLRRGSLVLCLFSNSAHTRKYEKDLVAELREKNLGHIVAIGGEEEDSTVADQTIAANAPELPDNLRTPFEIVFPQLLAYRLSLNAGLDPDNPSPDGVITRVVQTVRTYGG
jgi:tagatose-6-phosphate ketose/aldose isomerase